MMINSPQSIHLTTAKIAQIIESSGWIIPFFSPLALGATYFFPLKIGKLKINAYICGRFIYPSLNTHKSITMSSYKKIKKIEDESMRLRVASRLLTLRKQLSDEIPEKTATQTLLLATWNIREFGDNRTIESCYYIAEIIDHFDLVVVQEVNSRKLDGLDTVLSILGDNWSYILSDGVEGTAGGNEAMAFVYNTNKVRFTGMVGEIVLPEGKLMDGVQFARTPYMASFRAGWFDFRLCTVHIYYGSEKNSKGVVQRRLDEIRTLSDFLLKRQEKDDISYILLGDFNIPDVGGDYFNALIKEETVTAAGKTKTKEKFFIPEEIRKHPTDLGQVSHYDQIAFSLKLERSMVLYDDSEQKAGAFNFTKSVYRPDDWPEYQPLYQAAFDKLTSKSKNEEKYFTTKWRTFQMSDHLPLWVELKIDFSDQYLKTHIK